MPFQAFLWPCYFLDNGLSLSRARAVSCRVNLSHQLLFTLKALKAGGEVEKSKLYHVGLLEKVTAC